MPDFRETIATYKLRWPTSIVGILACLMMVWGLMFSRALMSIGSILMVVNLFAIPSLDLLKQLMKDNAWFKWGTLFIVTYLISGLYSIDTAKWMHEVSVKAPFLAFPVAFALIDLQDKRYRKALIWGCTIPVIAIIFRSTFIYISNIGHYDALYNYAQVLPTTVYNDHIRFSATLVGVYLIQMQALFGKSNDGTLFYNKIERMLSVISLLLMVGFVHLLATKTGLLTFYAVNFCLLVGLLYRISKWLLPLTAFACIGMAWLGYTFVPTMRTKIDYVRWEYKVYTEGNQDSYEYSDVGRLMSYKIGMAFLKKHPLLGVGAGDVAKDTKGAFGIAFPNTPDENRLVPHNQYLLTMVTVGIPMTIPLIMLTILPFILKGTHRKWVMINGVMLFICLNVEPFLDIQFGVFVFLFFTLYWANINKNLIPKSIV